MYKVYFTLKCSFHVDEDYIEDPTKSMINPDIRNIAEDKLMPIEGAIDPFHQRYGMGNMDLEIEDVCIEGTEYVGESRRYHAGQ